MKIVECSVDPAERVIYDKASCPVNHSPASLTTDPDNLISITSRISDT